MHDLCACIATPNTGLSVPLYLQLELLQSLDKLLETSKGTRVSNVLLQITPSSKTAPWRKERLSRGRFSALHCTFFISCSALKSLLLLPLMDGVVG